jgi:preprotein translocase subunit SecD
MNFIKYITSLVGIILFSITTAMAHNTDHKTSIVFQVIQNQMVFDSSTVESATVVPVDNKSDQYGLQLKLKNGAATKLEALTSKNIGKRVNFILDGVVISSPIVQSRLGAEFLMTGLTKVQAQAEKFVESITSLKK